MRLNAAPLALAALPAISTAQACHNYVLISVRGTYEPQGRSIAFTTMINQTLAALPHGTEYDAVYPASQNQTAYLGANDITAYIAQGLHDCPKQHYAILGYSQGASATALALSNMTDPTSASYKAVRAVLVVGNPSHVPGSSSNVDETGGDATRAYAGARYDAEDPGRKGIPQVYYEAGKVLDICHREDSVCAPEAPGASFYPGHLHYGEVGVQGLGARFLVGKLGGVNGTVTPTGTGTGTGASSTGLQPPVNTGGAGAVSASFAAVVSGILALCL